MTHKTPLPFPQLRFLRGPKTVEQRRAAWVLRTARWIQLPPMGCKSSRYESKKRFTEEVVMCFLEVVFHLVNRIHGTGRFTFMNDYWMVDFDGKCRSNIRYIHGSYGLDFFSLPIHPPSRWKICKKLGGRKLLMIFAEPCCFVWYMILKSMRVKWTEKHVFTQSFVFWQLPAWGQSTPGGLVLVAKFSWFSISRDVPPRKTRSI